LLSTYRMLCSRMFGANGFLADFVKSARNYGSFSSKVKKFSFINFSSIGSSFLWQFSRCSVARMHSVLQSGHLQCLLNRPLQVSSLRQCGNGIVDDEEECDCGTREECFDPCCDPLTCTLRAHAQCAAHQSCCHRCQFRPAGHICRASKSICDVPEVCTGDNGDCPLDGYLIDGTVCGINGQCWKGNCSDIEQQCKFLWGEDASSADEHCFERNQLGAEYGNCGTDRDGNLRKCALENIRCGSLHCRAGKQAPLDHRLNSFNLQFLHEAKQVQCKMVTQSSFGMVADGSSCGSGKVCVQSVCLPLTQVSPPVHCPSNNLALQCSGHGDCTTTQRCLCFDGWAGNACDIRSNTSRRISMTTATPNHLIIPSLAAGRTLNTTTLLAILLLVGVALLILLICLLFCYRRRSTAEFPEGLADEKLNESIPEIAQRSIKFGNMPSYREEKRKRKKNKRVYDALQRINEASDERDTVSLKSRESGSIGHTPGPGSAVGSAVSYSESPYASRQPMLSTMMNGSPASLLKKEHSGSRRLFSESELYGGRTECCSDIIQSPSRCSVINNHLNGMRYDRARNGYSTDSEIGLNHYSSRYMDTFVGADLSPTLSQTSLNRLAATPLKLNNIGMLLKQLQYNDDITSEAELSAVEADHMDHVDLGSNTESTRGFESHDPLKFSPNADSIPEIYEATTQLSTSCAVYEQVARHLNGAENSNGVGNDTAVCVNSFGADPKNNLHKIKTDKEQPNGVQSPKSTRSENVITNSENPLQNGSSSANKLTSNSRNNSLFSDTFRLEV
uniref:ADM-1 preproprotein (inferred by orthology to a C. elegans protein) n=1 Tax=Anisakis simplex TaxID=6269 RepID=A0A0M3K8X1_ANISI